MKKNKILIICLSMLIILGVAMVYSPKINNYFLDYVIRGCFILIVIFMFLYSVKSGTSTITLKRILRDVAEKTGLKMSDPKGIEKIGVPVTCYRKLEGDYNGFYCTIVPVFSGVGPLGDRMNLIFWGYIDTIIEIGPVNINANSKIDLPQEIKDMNYSFSNDYIRVQDNKLVLVLNYKCPNADDLIKIINLLTEIAKNKQ